MTHFLLSMSILSLLSIGAIFGFFYAWVCSTMWGLDSTDPTVAITAMQAMNASVRNPVFFPAFFLTPIILTVTACIAFIQEQKRSALLFGVGAATYLCGAFLITVVFNVPMNEALAQVVVPADRETAGSIWQSYSGSWQFWNQIRMFASLLALTLTGFALISLNLKSK